MQQQPKIPQINFLAIKPPQHLRSPVSDSTNHFLSLVQSAVVLEAKISTAQITYDEIFVIVDEDVAWIQISMNNVERV